MSSHTHKKNPGFTLIEVAVALAILGWVLGSALFVVKQYADERLHIRDKFSSQLVQWNQLMEQYQYAQGWRLNQAVQPDLRGNQQQHGMRWYWQLKTEEASGQGVFRLEIQTGYEESALEQAGLAIYLIGEN